MLFRSVAPEAEEHPFQGWLPYLKLVWQPSVQLLEVLSSSASLAMTDPGADGVGAVGDIRPAPARRVWRTVDRPAPCTVLCGLATCFGASTVMLGSEVAEPVAVCDIAMPLGPHDNAMERMATAEGATKFDDSLMICPPNRDAKAVSINAW